MVRVGIVGFGFMGKMHLNNYSRIDGADVAAICDLDPDKLSGGAGTAGNISGTEEAIDLTGIELFSDADEMFQRTDLDAVSITLPTYLHKEYTIKALRADLNVFCEKPMALQSADCVEMTAAADSAGKLLQVGHCIRFWPEYAETKRTIDSGKYGRVRAATFRRLSLTPTWSWNGWLLDKVRSGGAIHDLHIHDSDYVQYLFGLPDSVFTTAAEDPHRGGDHVLTQYLYGNGPMVSAEGGWIMADSFGFEMSFDIILEKASIRYNCNSTPSLSVHLDSEETLTPEVPDGDGYFLELDHFVKAVSGENVPKIITPEDSMRSVHLVEAEKESACRGCIVPSSLPL